MSDADIIVHFLQNIEWRLRANRLWRGMAVGVSIVLTFLTFIKVWDLVSPFKMATIRFFLSASTLLLFGYGLWLLRKTGSLDHAAGSIDHRARLNDEIKTAFWFIRNPHPSKWVDGQIQRAARTVSKIDLARAYPIVVPPASYAAFATAVVFAGLNFVALPLNHNWFALRAAPEMIRPETVRPSATTAVVPARKLVQDASGDTATLQRITTALQEMAARLQDSDSLRGVSQALMDRRLALAASELRSAATVLDREPVSSLSEIGQSLTDAADISRPELEALSDELVAAARSIANKNMAGAREALEQAAEEFEGLEEEI